MKISELIEQLKKYPADMEVLVPSYEDGFDPVTDCRPLHVVTYEPREWYYGVYDEVKVKGRETVLISSRFTRCDPII